MRLAGLVEKDMNIFSACHPSQLPSGRLIAGGADRVGTIEFFLGCMQHWLNMFREIWQLPQAFPRWLLVNVVLMINSYYNNW
jgi:hypothetical protein